MSLSAMPRPFRRPLRCWRASETATGGLTCRCCKAASTISSPTAPANCSTAPGKAASTYSSSPAGEIDGQGNVNLVSIGDYAHPKVRFPGSFGSAYLYYVVPKVILFRTEHSRRTLVPKVSFISGPGASAPNVYRPGGPVALVTNRCLFSFATGRFTLASVHPGHTVEEVIENTGFEFDMPTDVPQTPPPSARNAQADARGSGAATRRGLSAVRSPGLWSWASRFRRLKAVALPAVMRLR